MAVMRRRMGWNREAGREGSVVAWVGSGEGSGLGHLQEELRASKIRMCALESGKSKLLP